MPGGRHGAVADPVTAPSRARRAPSPSPLGAGGDGSAVDARQEGSEIADMGVVTEQSPCHVAKPESWLGLRGGVLA